MYNIAIVSDEPYLYQTLFEFIRRLPNLNNAVIDAYSDGKCFIDTCRNDKLYDIVFIDIEMPEIDGYTIGLSLREIDVDENIYIVFVSSHTDNLARLFSLHPFDFLAKPVSHDDFANVMNKLICRLDSDNNMIRIVCNRNTQSVSVNNIVYLESINRKVIIHTNSSKLIEVNESLGSLYARLKKKCTYFLRSTNRILLTQITFA